MPLTDQQRAEAVEWATDSPASDAADIWAGSKVGKTLAQHVDPQAILLRAFAAGFATADVLAAGHRVPLWLAKGLHHAKRTQRP